MAAPIVLGTGSVCGTLYYYRKADVSHSCDDLPLDSHDGPVSSLAAVDRQARLHCLADCQPLCAVVWGRGRGLGSTMRRLCACIALHRAMVISCVMARHVYW